MSDPVVNRELTREESLLLSMIGEWSGNNDVRLVLTFRYGAFEILSSVAPHDRAHSLRGIGCTFAEAWKNMHPICA